MPPQQKNILSRRRNKAIVSLLVHQGLRVEEVAALRLQDLQLREGKIIVHQQRRTAARTMQLQSHQVYELMDYIAEVRKEFLKEGEATDKSANQSDRQAFYPMERGRKFLWHHTRHFKNTSQYQQQNKKS